MEEVMRDGNGFVVNGKMDELQSESVLGFLRQSGIRPEALATALRTATENSYGNPVRFPHMDEIADILSKTNPSDHLFINDELARTFYDLLRQAEIMEEPGIPSDIFVANTVPIRDVLMTFTSDPATTFRIVVEDDGDVYIVHEMGAGKGENWNGHKFVMSNKIIPSEDGSLYKVDISTMYSLEPMVSKKLIGRTPDGVTLFVLDQTMKLWYAFQILLLNPQVKDVLLKKTGKEKSTGVCMSKRKSGRKAVYIKRHLVEGDIFEKPSGDGRTITRRTMCWYVIGHWREYKSGKRTFVQPYWKGPARQAKQNRDGVRERGVAV